jgi:methylmalonyl-CoA mutase cobalamin-binding subunit
VHHIGWVLPPTFGALAPSTGTVRERARPRVGRRAPVEEYVSAAAAGDFAGAEAIAARFMGATASRTAVVTDLLGAANLLISKRWRVGEARSDDEFRVSQAIERSIRSLPPPEPPPPGLVQPQALLATLRPEEHHLGLDLAAIALADDGWHVETRYRVDLGDLVDEVTRGRFRVVVFSSTYAAPETATRLAGAVRAMQALGKPVIVGGQAFARDRRLGEVVGPNATAADSRTCAVVARRYRSREWRRWSRSRLSSAR